jgi:hypothetical protein
MTAAERRGGKAVKDLTEMTVSELLEADRDTGNLLDAYAYCRDVKAHPPRETLRQRREIRAELERRHEARSDLRSEIAELARQAELNTPIAELSRRAELNTPIAELARRAELKAVKP